MKITTNQQMGLLRRFGDYQTSHRYKWAALISTLLCALLLSVSGEPAIFILFVCIAAFTLTEFRSISFKREALSGLDQGEHVSGRVYIDVDSSIDGEHYYAIVEGHSFSRWEIEFVPAGWQPEQRDYEAELYYSEDKPWPVLITVKEGLIMPSCDPHLQVTTPVI